MRVTFPEEITLLNSKSGLSLLRSARKDIFINFAEVSHIYSLTKINKQRVKSFYLIRIVLESPVLVPFENLGDINNPILLHLQGEFTITSTG